MPKIKINCFLSNQDEKKIDKKQFNSLNSDPDIKIEFLDDIDLGDETDVIIKKMLKTADITVLFLTANFTDFFHDNIKSILQRKSYNATELILVNLTANSLVDDERIIEQPFFPSSQDAIWSYFGSPNYDSQWVSLVRQIRITAERIKQQAESIPSKYNKIAELCNREEQNRQLTALLEKQEQLRSEKIKPFPAICFIHGSPEQNIDNYRERVKEFELKRILLKDRIEYGMNKSLPTKQYDLEDMTENLFDDLALRFLGKQQANKFRNNYRENQIDAVKSILDQIKSYPEEIPIMISYGMGTPNWKPVDIDGKITEPPEIIREFLEFWNEFGEFDLPHRIIVCVYFRYKEEDDQSTEITNKEVLSFLSSSGGAEIDKFKLPPEWFSRQSGYFSPEFKNICGTILTKLRSVEFSEVEDWLMREEKIDDFCSAHQPFCDIEMVKNKVEKEYVNQDDIPMKQLSKILVRQFERFGCCE